MKRNFFSLTFLLLLFYLCGCNRSNTETAKQNEAGAIPKLKAIFINGDSIHYIDVGKGDPVVFVHGAFGDYRIWEAQMDTFALHHRVISYSKFSLSKISNVTYTNNCCSLEIAESNVYPKKNGL